MKMSTKQAPSVAAYRVLIQCTNDKTGRTYEPGEIVTAADFPKAILYEWVQADPPVVAEVEDGSQSKHG